MQHRPSATDLTSAIARRMISQPMNSKIRGDTELTCYTPAPSRKLYALPVWRSRAMMHFHKRSFSPKQLSKAQSAIKSGLCYPLGFLCRHYVVTKSNPSTAHASPLPIKLTWVCPDLPFANAIPFGVRHIPAWLPNPSSLNVADEVRRLTHEIPMEYIKKCMICF